MGIELSGGKVLGKMTRGQHFGEQEPQREERLKDQVPKEDPQSNRNRLGKKTEEASAS